MGTVSCKDCGEPIKPEFARRHPGVRQCHWCWGQDERLRFEEEVRDRKSEALVIAETGWPC